jgi:hypothetical protein
MSLTLHNAASFLLSTPKRRPPGADRRTPVFVLRAQSSSWSTRCILSGFSGYQAKKGADSTGLNWTDGVTDSWCPSPKGQAAGRGKKKKHKRGGGRWGNYAACVIGRADETDHTTTRFSAPQAATLESSKQEPKPKPKPHPAGRRSRRGPVCIRLDQEPVPDHRKGRKRCGFGSFPGQGATESIRVVRSNLSQPHNHRSRKSKIGSVSPAPAPRKSKSKQRCGSQFHCQPDGLRSSRSPIVPFRPGPITSHQTTASDPPLPFILSSHSDKKRPSAA